MKKKLHFVIKSIVFMFIMAVVKMNAVAQLVGGTTYPINGTDNGINSFASLRSAIGYLQTNGAIGTGQVVLEFTSAYTPSLADAPMVGASSIVIPNIPGTSSTLGVTIRPAVGVSVDLSTTLDGASLIELNGASYITIDGRPGGTGTTRGLTIENLSTSAVASTSTIGFYNDAVFNTVIYTTIKGATPNSAGTAGTVLFGSSYGTLGNSNNTVSNNVITGASSSGKASYHILSAGSVGAVNQSNTISNNDISNYQYRGIFLNMTATTIGLGNNWIISGNSVYNTSSLITGTGRAICIAGTTGNYTSGHVIEGNYIGGTAPQCGGIPMQVDAYFYGIDILANQNSQTIIKNNTIANIVLNHSAALTGAVSVFLGINMAAGDLLIEGNTIGSQTANGNIELNLANTGAFSQSIYAVVTGGGKADIKQNNIGGIRINSNASVATRSFFRAISVFATMTEVSITENIIGGTTPNSLEVLQWQARPFYTQGIATFAPLSTVSSNTVQNISNATNDVTHGISLSISSGTMNADVKNNNVNNIANTAVSTGGGQTYGIILSGTVDGYVQNNTVNNISSTSTITNDGSYTGGISVQGTTANGLLVKANKVSNITSSIPNTTNSSYAAVFGINATSSGYNVQIVGNEVYGLSSTAATTTHVLGIGMAGTGADRAIYGNKIYNLTNPNTDAGSVKGIVVRGPSAGFTCYNNIISLTNTDGNAAVYGIENNSGTTLINIYYNTILLSGTASGSSNSAAIFRSVVAPLDIKNNILFNARTGGSGTHTVFYATDVSASWTSDYNLFASNSGDAVALWNGVSYNLSGWQGANFTDFNSSSYSTAILNPTLLFAGESSAYFMSVQNAYASYFIGKGTILPITVDFNNDSRNALAPSLGAYEVTTETLLPVNIIAFSGSLVNGKVQLKWSVGAETNVNRYEIEHRQDNGDFIKVAEVDATGSSTYSVAVLPTENINYYRLKSVDNDASFAYFKDIVSIKLPTLSAAKLEVYPNPLIGNTLNLNFAGYPKYNYTYQVVDITGKVVALGQLDPAQTQHAINLAGHINQGIYMIRIIGNGQAIQSKFVRQ